MGGIIKLPKYLIYGKTEHFSEMDKKEAAEAESFRNNLQTYVTEQNRKLASLFEDGILTEEDFKNKKY